MYIDVTVVLTYQKNWANGFGGMSHVNGSRVAEDLCEKGQGAAVVEVEVRNDDAVQVVVQGTFGSDVGEVGEASLKRNTFIFCSYEGELKCLTSSL